MNRLRNQYKTVEFRAFSDKPKILTLQLTSEVHAYTKELNVTCIAEGNPTPVLKWKSKFSIEVLSSAEELYGQTIVSRLMLPLNALQRGRNNTVVITCIAINMIGNSSHVIPITNGE